MSLTSEKENKVAQRCKEDTALVSSSNHREEQKPATCQLALLCSRVRYPARRRACSVSSALDRPASSSLAVPRLWCSFKSLEKLRGEKRIDLLQPTFMLGNHNRRPALGPLIVKLSKYSLGKQKTSRRCALLKKGTPPARTTP